MDFYHHAFTKFLNDLDCVLRILCPVKKKKSFLDMNLFLIMAFQMLYHVKVKEKTSYIIRM